MAARNRASLRTCTRHHMPATDVPAAASQVKSLADAELNYAYMRGALLANGSRGCKRAAVSPPPASAPVVLGPHLGADVGGYVTYPSTYMPTRASFGRGPSLVVGGGLNWSLAKAASECDKLAACHAFSMTQKVRPTTS